MAKAMVYLQSGGPTAVINSSLYGAIVEAKKHEEISGIYGSMNGVEGLIGDDLIDLPVMRRAGLPVAVADAAPEAKAAALLVTEHAGGHGAIRETAELLLRAQGLFEDAAAQYLLS